jgi:hypothetical protein
MTRGAQQARARGVARPSADLPAGRVQQPSLTENKNQKGERHGGT